MCYARCCCSYSLYFGSNEETHFRRRHKLTSQRGSLVSGLLSSIGYLSFSLLLSKATPDTPLIHIWLTIAFFCVGAATVGAYFACLTCGMEYPFIHRTLPDNRSITIFPFTSDFIVITPIISGRPIVSLPIFLLNLIDLSNPSTSLRPECHQVPHFSRNPLPTRQRLRRRFHASHPSSPTRTEDTSPPSCSRRDGRVRYRRFGG